jgi:hypothetical protein
MLELHDRLNTIDAASERERLQRLIDATDKQIDALVYELYGLTAEEIAIVEGAQITAGTPATDESHKEADN